MIQGKNITLRPLKISDWKGTIKWRNNITIKKLAMMHPFPITEMVEKEWYEDILKSKSNKTIYFTIEGKDSNPIGFIALNNINYIHKICALGIVIGEQEAQDKGFGEEALGLIIGYAFNTLNLNKISVEVVDFNKKALSLYKKLGFIEEGRFKQQFYADGLYSDVILMSVFKN